MPRQRVSLPVWALVVGGVVVGAIVAGSAVALLRSTSTTVITASDTTQPSSTTATTAPSTTAVPPTTIAPTTVPATTPPPPITVPPTTAPPPPPRQPQGTLVVLRGNYGQGFATGSCANWRIGLKNSTDTPIVRITFAPPSAQFTDFTSFNQQTKSYPTIEAATPAAATVSIYIPPGDATEVAFQACSDTPHPGGPYQFFATAPRSISYQWSTGQWGESCYNLGCP